MTARETEANHGAAGPRRPVTLGGMTAAAGLLVLLATALGFGGPWWWFADLFSHFRVQYALLLVPMVVLLGVSRRPRSALVLAFALVANLVWVVPLYFGGEAVAPAGAEARRAMLINVNTAYGDVERVGEAIAAQDPDILVLEEVSERWVRALAGVLARFPYSEVVPREDNFGIALHSKLPFTSCEVLEVGGASVPSILVHVHTGSDTFAVLATHPLPPRGAEYARRRNAQLSGIPQLVGDLTVPLLLLGDLNTTPWNHHFRRLLRDTGLHDSSAGRGARPTWPAALGPLGIPLDHCLHSSGILVTAKTVGDPVGSDHLPVIVDFVLVRE